MPFRLENIVYFRPVGGVTVSLIKKTLFDHQANGNIRHRDVRGLRLYFKVESVILVLPTRCDILNVP